MLFPDDEGMFECDNGQCSYFTDDLFDMIAHHGVEYEWNVRLSPSHSFDLFKFLLSIDESLEDPEELHQLVQSALMLFLNASRDELDDFIIESTIVTESDSMISSIERMLNSNDK